MTRFELCFHLVASGWAKTVRTSVATMAWAAFGTRVSKVAHGMVRHRCHAAPVRTAAMAPFSPRGHLRRQGPPRTVPRATRPRRNAVQPAPSSALMTSTRAPPVAVGVHACGDDRGEADDAPALSHLVEEGVEP